VVQGLSNINYTLIFCNHQGLSYNISVNRRKKILSAVYLYCNIYDPVHLLFIFISFSPLYQFFRRINSKKVKEGAN